MKHKLCILYALIFNSVFIRIHFTGDWMKEASFIYNDASAIVWVKVYDDFYSPLPKWLS